MKINLQGNALQAIDRMEFRHQRLNFPGFIFHAGPFTAFQTAPERRLVHVKELNGDRSEETFEILTPWILYIVSVFDKQLSNLWMMGSPTRISSLNQRLYRLPLPNLYRDGRFCMPRDAVTAPDTTQELYEAALSIAWESYYNSDLFSEFSRDVWSFPFFDYPDDLPDHDIFRRTFESMLSPGDVMRAWEENIDETNMIDLFSGDMRVNTDYLKDEIPQFSARNIVAANHLQYMG